MTRRATKPIRRRTVKPRAATEHPAEENARDESGLTKTEQAKLEGMAIRKGWIQVPFPTRVPEKVLREEAGPKDNQTIVDKAAISVLDGLKSRDLRRRGIAERNAISMESHNLAMEREADPTPVPVNVTVSTDVTQAMEALAKMPREELEKLAAAQEVIDRVRASAQNPAPTE